MFPTISVDKAWAVNQEPLGTKPKFWYQDPESEQQLLFKAEERGTGEDWAEKVACELAGLLGLPHVHYDLAVEMNSKMPGVVCASCAPAASILALGNQVLHAIDQSYPKDAARYGASAHTVKAVAKAMWLPSLPAAEWCADLPPGIVNAKDVFVGYLMLDAWIANQDRHHENWGCIWDGEELRLAPTFDHGASLARNISDMERKERLTTRDENRMVTSFCRKARSAMFASDSDRKPLTTLEAWDAFSKYAPEAAILWRRQLESIDDRVVGDVLKRIPPNRMSGICRQFTMALLAENRQRILKGKEA